MKNGQMINFLKLKKKYIYKKLLDFNDKIQRI